AWDALGGPTADGPNDLEPAALHVEPRMTWWRDAIGTRLGMAPVLAGSGATWFAEGEHQDALGDLIGEGAEVVVTRAVPAS
ncbi:MAG: 4-(cytidine 5'-diphospho)-2-C-methyl-D-erythritol kinase, partial [Ilumatobacteraceae bacterium]